MQIPKFEILCIRRALTSQPSLSLSLSPPLYLSLPLPLFLFLPPLPLSFTSPPCTLLAVLRLLPHAQNTHDYTYDIATWTKLTATDPRIPREDARFHRSIFFTYIGYVEKCTSQPRPRTNPCTHRSATPPPLLSSPPSIHPSTLVEFLFEEPEESKRPALPIRKIWNATIGAVMTKT